tara:strand:- start:1582 stop:2964 length:1383 start_codon:yes stop_codon:yes gene_type:complete
MEDTIHIVGAGPTGMSIAWELLTQTDKKVIIYEKKSSAGGSWWEPTLKKRDIHAPRILFRDAFVNTDSILQEMGVNWDDVFKPTNESEQIKGRINSSLLLLYLKVVMFPDNYKEISMKEIASSFGPDTKEIIKAITLVTDGVSWDVMTAYEFIKSFDNVAFSEQYTQRVSGKVMCDAMQNALREKGARFRFNTSLEDIEYSEDSFKATLSDGKVIDSGEMIICIESSSAANLLKDNWGPDAKKLVKFPTYTSINVIYEFDKPLDVPDTMTTVMNTKWNIITSKLEPNILSCTILIIPSSENKERMGEIMGSSPEKLMKEVIDQLGTEKPQKSRLCWGSYWDGESWDFRVGSAALSKYGSLPFYGKCSRVAMCGMMSGRNTPYASIEAAVEIGRKLCSEKYNTRYPIESRSVSGKIITIGIIIIFYKIIYSILNKETKLSSVYKNIVAIALSILIITVIRI